MPHYRAFLCLALLMLAGCDQPLITVNHTSITESEASAQARAEAAAQTPAPAYPPQAYYPPPRHPQDYAAYPQAGYASRPDYYAVQDRNGHTFYCFKPTVPVQIEEKGKATFGFRTVAQKIRCRHPRTGAITDATDDIVPLTPPY